MLDALMTRLRQGHRTAAYPVEEPVLPERFCGRPVLDAAKCRSGACRACCEVCPVAALTLGTGVVAAGSGAVDGKLSLDSGACLFCGACAAACPQGAITFSREYRLAACRREDLVITPETAVVATAFSAEAKRVFGRSLKLRAVSAGGCSACEADSQILNSLVYDLGRFGIQFVASPRHADGVFVTGPVTQNMRAALLKTYEAVAVPKLVIAVGACAVAGGPYRGHAETCSGVTELLPVDLFVPGCPPHPYTILDGLLRLLGRI